MTYTVTSRIARLAAATLLAATLVATPVLATSASADTDRASAGAETHSNGAALFPDIWRFLSWLGFNIG